MDIPALKKDRDTGNYPNFISENVLEGRYYVHEPFTQGKNGFRVICAGMEVCQKAYRIDRKNFDYYAIEFIANGNCKLELDDKKSEIGSGCCFIYGPNTPHKIFSVGDKPLKKYFVDFDGSDALARMHEFNLKEGDMFYVGNQRWVQDIFEQFIESSELKRKTSRALVEQLLKLLFVRLLIDREIPGKLQSFSNETFTRCWRFIYDNYLNINTVGEISDACAVNKVYIARLFKRYANETPFQLLTRLKIKHAAKLILGENLPVKQVGAIVGYSDPYHFSRVFKRIIGVSPKHYAYLIKRGAIPFPKSPAATAG
ncbi:MAG: helix-turn-helix domain-containing protein [Verrucomicrobia bacterium]|nr:helix-turn-helix domain-containing protein [Verrucomicrobiota bacterium]